MIFFGALVKLFSSSQATFTGAIATVEQIARVSVTQARHGGFGGLRCVQIHVRTRLRALGGPSRGRSSRYPEHTDQQHAAGTPGLG